MPLFLNAGIWRCAHAVGTNENGWRYFRACGMERNVHWWRYDFDAPLNLYYSGQGAFLTRS